MEVGICDAGTKLAELGARSNGLWVLLGYHGTRRTRLEKQELIDDKGKNAAVAR